MTTESKLVEALTKIEHLENIVDHLKLNVQARIATETRLQDRLDQAFDVADLYMTRHAMQQVRADRLEHSIDRINGWLSTMLIDNQTENNTEV